MTQVAAILTPSTAPHVAAAIVAAYHDLRGHAPPTKSSWLWPLALSANETDQWRSMFNWNIGSVTTSSEDVSWFFNPKVISSALKFRAFDGALSGAFAMLKTLDRHGGLVAAETGDAGGWQIALNAYLGGGVYPSLSSLISRLDSVQPEGGAEYILSPSKKEPGTMFVVATALCLAAAAGYAAHLRHEVIS
jgi:hypothetical protein